MIFSFSACIAEIIKRWKALKEQRWEDLEEIYSTNGSLESISDTTKMQPYPPPSPPPTPNPSLAPFHIAFMLFFAIFLIYSFVLCNNGDKNALRFYGALRKNANGVK